MSFLAGESKKSFKILIVDDELLIRRSLKLASESRGHIAQTAKNGRDALSLWADFKPDLAFIDILMPEMSGWELLKNIPGNSRAKIIIISAHDETSAGEIKKSAADLFIPKPFDNIFRLIERGEALVKNHQDKSLKAP